MGKNERSIMDKVLLAAYEERIKGMCKKKKGSKAILLSYAGETMTLKEWAEYLGLKYDTLRLRYYRSRNQPGWTISRVLNPKLERNMNK